MKSLSEKEQIFVNALASGATVIEASRRAGVTEQTGHLWKKRPHVKAALEEARAAVVRGRIKVIETVSSENAQATFPRMSRKLEEGAEEALDFLLELVRDGEARKSDRLKASLELLRLSGFQAQPKASDLSVPAKGGKRGLSEETAAVIRRRILGIEEDAIEQEVV
jgi:transposase-like protein